MVDKIETGHYYKLSFNKENWPDLEMYVMVSGITNKAAMGNITEYDIKEELFQAYELGLSTYLQTTNCDLLIVNEITDLSTQEVDTDNRILVPILMIDYAATEKLFMAQKISFTIEGIKRRFETDLDQDEYIRDARVELANHLNMLDNFAGDNVEINYTITSALTEEKEILSEEKQRIERLHAFKEANNQDNLQREETMRNALYLQQKYDVLLTELNTENETLKVSQEKNNDYYDELMAYTEVNDNYSRLLRKLCELMTTRGQELGIEVEDYDTFVANARGEIAEEDKEEEEEESPNPDPGGDDKGEEIPEPTPDQGTEETPEIPPKE